MPVGVAERSAHGAGNPERGIDRQLALAVQPVPQTLAAGIGHHEIQQTVAFPRVMDREDLGMGKPGGNADLAQEALGLVRMAVERATTP